MKAERWSFWIRSYVVLPRERSSAQAKARCGDGMRAAVCMSTPAAVRFLTTEGSAEVHNSLPLLCSTV